MPPKKKRAPPKKRKYTQKQKQKQKQSVNVKVSTGGGGGGTSFIPMPMNQAPQFDPAQLLQGLAAIRAPPTVPAPIAEAVREPAPQVMSQVRAAEQASMGPLQGGMSSSSSRGKSVSFTGEPLSARTSSAPSASESESDVAFRKPKSDKSSQYYRSSGVIPPESIGKGKKTQYEEDIFGRYMPKTSDIRSSSSFEPIAMGGGKSNVRYASDYLFSPSGGDTSDTGARSAAARMAFA